MTDGSPNLRRAGGAADVEVAIDPAELEGLDEEAVRALYDERLAQQQSTASREVTRSLLTPCEEPAQLWVAPSCNRLPGETIWLLWGLQS